jgi:hypothetical protein
MIRWDLFVTKDRCPSIDNMKNKCRAERETPVDDVYYMSTIGNITVNRTSLRTDPMFVGNTDRAAMVD